MTTIVSAVVSQLAERMETPVSEEHEVTPSKRFLEVQRKDGTWILHLSKRGGGKAHYDDLCHRVEAVTSACAQTGERCTRSYAFKHKHTGKVVVVSVNEADLYADMARNRLAGTFADRGLRLGGYSGAAFPDYLASLNSDALTLQTSSLGWNGPTFVTHERTLAPAAFSDTPVVYNGGQSPILSALGTAAAWVDFMGPHMSESPWLMFCIGLALAGPTTELVSKELGGGACLYGASSRGKTTAGFAAASVWGDRKHFFQSWNNTVNYLLSQLSERNSLFLVLDEFHRATKALLDSPQFLLADGESRGRCDLAGDAKEKRTWCLQALVTNEVSMEEQGRRAKIEPRDGASVRVPGIQIPSDERGIFPDAADASHSRAAALSIEEFTLHHYGAVGDAWLRYLVENREACAQRIRADVDRLSARWSKGKDSQAKRGIRRFALVAATLLEARTALRMASYFDSELVEHHVGMLAKAWVDATFDGGRSLTATRAIKNTLHNLQTYRSRFAVRLNNPDGSRAGWTTPNYSWGFLADPSDDTFYVFAPSLAEVLGDVDLAAGREALANAGAILEPRAKQVHSGPNGKNTRYYVIHLAALEGECAVTELPDAKNLDKSEPVTSVTAPQLEFGSDAG